MISHYWSARLLFEIFTQPRPQLLKGVSKSQQKWRSKSPKEKQDPLGYPLHECVFRGDVKELSGLIRAGHDLSKVDPHGNSALHLAVMLGRRECVHLLCAHGAPVKIKNKQGWSPIAEAIRYF